MKKTTILIIVVLFMVIGYAAYNVTFNIYGKNSIVENLSNFNVYFHSIKVNGNEVEGINSNKDSFTIEGNINGTVDYEIINDSTDYDANTFVNCTIDDNTTGNTLEFDYTGGEQVFTALEDAVYKLETWGAQGATDSTTYHGGYGGYSVGEIKLSKGDRLYVYVGEKGKKLVTDTNVGQFSSYPNGGAVKLNSLSTLKLTYSSGGGSTHISNKQGLISDLYNTKNNIVMVAGGGGGTSTYWGYNDHGGSGGGVKGGATTTNFPNGSVINNNPTGGDQRSGGTGGGNLDGHNATGWLNGVFGVGGGTSVTTSTTSVSGAGGGGFYGGGASWGGSGAGGSGYIGNSLLKDKIMYCYNCLESSEMDIKTISTTCVSETPTTACAKSGNGYARITQISVKKNINSKENMIVAQEIISSSIPNLKAKSITCKLNISKLERTEKNDYSAGHIWKYEYTGDEQAFIAPTTGTYKLEIWGAQGATDSTTYHGGYGGYSSGDIQLIKGDKLFIYVGEKGKNINTSKETGEVFAYPNGGAVKTLNIGDHYMIYSSGGGSTHISNISGLISNLKDQKNSILIVAGGGGGACTWWKIEDHGGSGGGYIGTTTSKNYTNGNTINFNPTAGSQSSGGSGGGNLYGNNPASWLNGKFGIGGGSKVTNTVNISSGGGGGFYGGGASWGGSAAGGSGYIGNSLLSNKAMYCYNCQESKDISTKTISTTCTSATPKENCSKQGNGYARITLVNVS